MSSCRHWRADIGVVCKLCQTGGSCESVCIDVQHVPTLRDLKHYCKITSVFTTSVLFPGGCQGAIQSGPVSRVLNFAILARHCWCPQLTMQSMCGWQHTDEACASPFDIRGLLHAQSTQQPPHTCGHASGKGCLPVSRF